MSELAQQIEQYLLSRRGWVPAADLCAQFGIRQRGLRGLRNKPGLCSDFAISGDKGYLHVRWATEPQWTRFQARMRDHAIMELTRVKRLRERRGALQEEVA